MKTTAVVLVGHGSKEKGFQAAMERVAGKLRTDGRFSLVLCAYLGSAAPSIREAIESCVSKKIKKIVVVPYFVLTGKHVNRDIPVLVKEAARKCGTAATISLAPYLGYDDGMVKLVRKRIREAK